LAYPPGEREHSQAQEHSARFFSFRAKDCAEALVVVETPKSEEKELMRPRVICLISLAILVAATTHAQEATKVCSDGHTIRIASQWDQLGLSMAASDVAAQPLRYSISDTRGVRAAWVEVWDRPKRLSRKAVPVVREGEASCTGCLDADETPRELYISIFDPDEPLICIDYCAPGTPMSGWYVSEVMVGKRPVEDGDESEEPSYLMNYPSLTGKPIRILEGTGSTNVVLPGEDLIPSSRVYLVAGEGKPPNSASRTYLYSRTVDLRHVEVTLPSDMLGKPGVLTAYVKDSWEGKDAEPSRSGQKITVASKDSPVIHSIEPDTLRCCDSRDSEATVVLRGSGFTKNSEVTFGDDELTHGDVIFVSPNELRVTFPAYELQDGSERYLRATPLMLTVVNGPLEISAPAEVRVLPSAKFKLQPLPAMIRAIAPYPVPMMDFQSPEFLTLEISGDNFRPNDVVAFDNKVSDRTRLKTQYISSHHLRAWLPRESWRKHRMSFRLIVQQTSTGFCAAEAFADSLE
jgi:hypothetical protein